MELAAVGQNVKELRTARGLRLADLAEITGYTTSYLSQIERGFSIPSLSALAAVAMALGVEMATLLDSRSGPTVHITRADEGELIRLPNDSLQFRVLASHGPEGSYTAIVHGAHKTPKTFRHFGERFMLVLEGSVRMRFGDEQHDLNASEALHYGAHEAHELTDTGDTEVKLLMISSPALF
ncbi:MAG: helix-turn-helix domain-containing protein [Acidimicrobiia bacterium]